MFVSSESLGEIQKLFFYNDKELPKGSKSERLVSQFLELSDNPKGNSAYKLFSTMSEEKKFVTEDIIFIPVTRTQKAFIEQLQLNANDYHNFLLDALERATHFCELDLTKEQLSNDYTCRYLATQLLEFKNSNKSLRLNITNKN